MDQRNSEKRRRLETSLQYGVTMVHVDARRPGVTVPVRFRQEHNLKLNLSFRFEPRDLTVNDWGVRETLSFGGAPFRVAIPWTAIYAITSSVLDGATWVYAEDMPLELIEAAAKRWGLTDEQLEQLRKETAKSGGLTEVEPLAAPDRPRGFVPRVVASPPPEAGDPGEAGTADGEVPPPKGGRGCLRLVK